MEYFDTFLRKQSKALCYEVLNALPGHGKTVALKIFAKKMIADQHLVSGLIVLREKEQMREMESFLKGFPYGGLYIDSDNYHLVKDDIHHYQFVIISHERLKALALEHEENIADSENKFSQFASWNGKRRVIMIDEMPIFMESAVYGLDEGMKWLDDCFHVSPSTFSTEERVIIRSNIHILFAKEFMANHGPLTGALQNYLDSEGTQALFEEFFEEVDCGIQNLYGTESYAKYQWFKKLFHNEGSGYLDRGLYLKGFVDHKKIICSRRVNYLSLSCPILILDGTAVHSRRLYNSEFEIVSLPNYIDYNRLSIYQRKINTSARQRKSRKTFLPQDLIAGDIQGLNAVGISPFPLMNKFEVRKYLSLKVISREDYERYFTISYDDHLPVNILNTVGKNYLADKKSLYLTSIPSRPAVYYKALAISLHGKDEEPLNLSMLQEDKLKKAMWFADSKIEELYTDSVLSEVFQIIHRSNIRNLLSQELVHIYIATKYDHIIDELVSMFQQPMKFKRSLVEEDSKFRIKLVRQVQALAEKIKIEQIELPQRIGKLDEGTSLKNDINRNWEDKRLIIDDVFTQYGLEIKVVRNKSGDLWKKVYKL